MVMTNIVSMILIHAYGSCTAALKTPMDTRFMIVDINVVRVNFCVRINNSIMRGMSLRFN